MHKATVFFLFSAIIPMTSLSFAANPVPPVVLHVGPGKTYAQPSQAIAAAHDGDIIEIATDGNYFNDVANIDKNNLTIRGVGKGFAVMKTDGRVFGHKGIWVFARGFNNLTVSDIDFEGARVGADNGENGAGLRAQGTNLTVRHCRFYNNQDGILGGYGKTLIEYCEFSHNGLTGLTHNVYISDQAGTLIFQFNYSHDSQVGHLLKSRAASNHILYNRLTDEAGSGSYEMDLPNGGVADIVGNIIQQSATSQNGIIVSYGEEGHLPEKSELNVINNTFVNDRNGGTFIRATNPPGDFKLNAKNNIFAGPGTPFITTPSVAPIAMGNVMTTIAGAKFINAGEFNFNVSARSPAIGAGVNPGADESGFSLVPTQQYVQPTSNMNRSAGAKLDAGAYQLKK